MYRGVGLAVPLGQKRVRSPHQTLLREFVTKFPNHDLSTLQLPHTTTSLIVFELTLLIFIFGGMMEKSLSVYGCIVILFSFLAISSGVRSEKML